MFIEKESQCCNQKVTYLFMDMTKTETILPKKENE